MAGGARSLKPPWGAWVKLVSTNNKSHHTYFSLIFFFLHNVKSLNSFLYMKIDSSYFWLKIFFSPHLFLTWNIWCGDRLFIIMVIKSMIMVPSHGIIFNDLTLKYVSVLLLMLAVDVFQGLNVYSILLHDTLVMSRDAVNKIVERMHTPINR